MDWIILGSGSFYVKRHDFNCSFTCVSGALLFVSFCASWGPGKGTGILKRWATLSSASLNFVLGGACVRLLCCSRSCFFFRLSFRQWPFAPYEGTLWSPHSGLHSDCCQLEAPPPGDRWHEISLVVNCKEGRAFLSVDGKQAGQRFVFPPFINGIMPCPRCAHSLAPLFIKGRNQADLLVLMRFATTRVKAGWSLVKVQAGLLTWENPFLEQHLSPAPYLKPELQSTNFRWGNDTPLISLDSIIVACRICRCALPACLRQITFGYQARRLPTLCFLGGPKIHRRCLTCLN